MEFSEFLVAFLSHDSDTTRTSGLAVTEVSKLEGLGNRCDAGCYGAWVNLYITRGTEEEYDKGTAKGYKNW
jgi:hypothetical protein